MTKQELDELEKVLGCLIPKPGASAPSCHEKSICDCTALRLMSLAGWALEAREALLEFSGYSGALDEAAAVLSKFPKEDECKQQNVIV